MMITTEVELDIDIEDITNEIDFDSTIDVKIKSLLDEYLDNGSGFCEFGEMFRKSIVKTVLDLFRDAGMAGMLGHIDEA